MAKKNVVQQEEDAAAATPDEPEPVELDPVAELEARVAELDDKLLRARADYDNLQKRHLRDADAERARAKARVLEPFLQVFEFSQMAAVEAEKAPGALAEGVKMLTREFERAIQDQGITTFGATGDKFDANLHEAIGDADAGLPPGHVTSVARTGYKLGDRILRYAKVTIQPAPATADEQPAEPLSKEEE